MVGGELAPMINRIISDFGGLQSYFEYNSFSKVSESLFMLEKLHVLGQ